MSNTFLQIIGRHLLNRLQTCLTTEYKMMQVHDLLAQIKNISKYAKPFSSLYAYVVFLTFFTLWNHRL